MPTTRVGHKLTIQHHMKVQKVIPKHDHLYFYRTINKLKNRKNQGFTTAGGFDTLDDSDEKQTLDMRSKHLLPTQIAKITEKTETHRTEHNLGFAAPFLGSLPI